MAELRREQKIEVKGRSVRRAWLPGKLPMLMDQGLTLREAQEEASRRGWEVGEPETVDNLVVTVGKGLVADLLIDEEGTGLTYHAIGTGSTAPSVGDTALVTEVNRKTWTSRTRTGASLLLSVFYTAAEATYSIEEAAVYGGDAASATADSGTLFSRYLQSYDNSSGSVDLTFDYNLDVT